MCLRFGNRIINKRTSCSCGVEHVQQSRCAEEFKLRKKKNDELKTAAKDRGETMSTKRQPKGPKPGFMVDLGDCNPNPLRRCQRSQGRQLVFYFLTPSVLELSNQNLILNDRCFVVFDKFCVYQF
ncbi:unnamed protein product [Eruca vesicaria subsp. sativa]|uniref:Uncharacterized protein n=1 Tax=Eruca vesicaria subsp. sativa TaxID=29727 RepID=A0ABC8J341_ERUVS|nr:unnamed protein product [Eruca vesicaria subsp. sativa]